MDNIKELSREEFFKRTNNKLLVVPLRIISLITIVSGLIALIFEVKYFTEFSLQVYLGRLIATTTAFYVFTYTYTKKAEKNPVFFIHVLLLSILVSFGSVIYFIPETLFINSNIMALVIFTVALFLSWELKHQIILAIYYNLVFAVSILMNKSNVYVMPNIFETVLFVMFISVMAVIASSINYKLRKEAIYQTFEAARLEQKYQNIFNNNLDGIFRLFNDFNINTVNPAFNSLFGYDEEVSLNGLPFGETLFISDEEYRKFTNLIETQGKVKNFRTVLKNKDGNEVFVRLNASVLANEEGIPEFIDGSLQDISKQISLEKQRNDAFNDLKKAKKKAEELAAKASNANTVKTKFLAKINHDLRIPLNNVLGYMELIENMAFKDLGELKDLAKTARVSADTLLDIIGDNIDIARIESGKIDSKNEEFNLDEVLEKSFILVSSKAEAKGIKLLWNSDENIPDRLYGDPSRYRQVLVNLLSNAIKFTDNGAVKVEAAIKSVSGDNILITTKVSDTGRGIESSELEKIFHPFYQSGKTESNDGAGLGLSICREITDYLNGELKVKSEPGKGSMFYFTIPFINKSEDKEKESRLNLVEFHGAGENLTETIEIKGEAAKGTILIVEDNPHNRAIEMKLLSQTGYNVIGVPNGYAALDELQKHTFNLILMDLQMEGMDGLETTERIRSLDKPLCDIPIIAVTAHSSMRDREMCLKAGMNDYVEKPISIRYLKMIIDRWMDKQATA